MVVLESRSPYSVAPSGHVPGIDVTDALGIAEARRYGVAGVSERPEVAEAGLVEALDDNTGD